MSDIWRRFGAVPERIFFVCSLTPVSLCVYVSLTLKKEEKAEFPFPKRCSIPVAANPLADVVERVNDIYMSVVESEECMQRIACEIGGLAEDVGLKENSLAK